MNHQSRPESPPRRKVVILPPIAWLPERAAWQPGQGPNLSALEQHLAIEGFDCEIIDPLPKPWNPFARYHPLLRGIDPLRSLRVLAGWRKADVIMCVFEGPAVIPVLLRRLFGFHPRVVMWDIGLTDVWRIRQKLQDIIVPRLDGIFVLGRNQIGEIARRWPKHARVTHVGHYIDTEFFRPFVSQRSGGRPLILSVGDDEGRDYPTLLDAVAGIDAEIVIRSGRQLPLRGGGLHSLRLISERITFLALRQLYADAMIVVLPLRDLPHPSGITGLLEAAAMGCPTIVSDSAGIRDWCRDEETCLVVPCQDSEALATAVRRLLADSSLRSRLARNARMFVEQECSPAAFAAGMARQLSAICG